MSIKDLNDDILNIIIDKLCNTKNNCRSIDCEVLARVSKRFYNLINDSQYNYTIVDHLLKCQTSNDLGDFYEKYKIIINGNIDDNAYFETYYKTFYIFCEYLFNKCLWLARELTMDFDKSYFIALVINYINNAMNHNNEVEIFSISLKNIFLTQKYFNVSYLKRIQEHLLCIKHCDNNDELLNYHKGCCKYCYKLSSKCSCTKYYANYYNNFSMDRTSNYCNNCNDDGCKNCT